MYSFLLTPSVPRLCPSSLCLGIILCQISLAGSGLWALDIEYVGCHSESRGSIYLTERRGADCRALQVDGDPLMFLRSHLSLSTEAVHWGSYKLLAPPASLCRRLQQTNVFMCRCTRVMRAELILALPL